MLVLTTWSSPGSCRVWITWFDVPPISCRSQLQRMASVLVEAVQNSDKNVLGPIRSALDAAVRRGVAAAEGAHPQQVDTCFLASSILH